MDLRLSIAKFPPVANSEQRAENCGAGLPRTSEAATDSYSEPQPGGVCLRTPALADLDVLDRAQGEERVDCLPRVLRSDLHHHMVL